MTDSPIFIVGCPRSGTGLLQDLLRSHPRLTFAGESHFIPSFYRAYGDPGSEREAVRLAARILRLYWIRPWKLPLAPDDFANDRSFREIVARLFETWARREGKPRWGNKTPEYVGEIETLRELFPACRILHIIRDGRDVALSWVRAGFGPENVFTAATRWRRLVRAGRRSGRVAPRGSYREIRYESLLGDPEATMRDVCEFLDEPFDPAVLVQRRIEFGLERRLVGAHGVVRRSGSTIVKGNKLKWKTGMTHADRILFESVAGDLLAELGYETSGDKRRIGLGERAFWNAHHACWIAMDRLNTLDKRSWLPSFMALRRADLRARLRGDAAGRAR